ncbi:MAG: biotin/lipoyl-containing protein [Gammaproteobacteria bacterium]
MDIDEVVIPVPTKTARDATVLVLFASPGDTISGDQLIALLDGDKGVLQVSSPFSGVVKAVQVKAGARVAPGSPILTLDRTEETHGGRSEGNTIDTCRSPTTLHPPWKTHLSGVSTPTLAAFQRQIEVMLGSTLTAPATLAAVDFWTHWQAFTEGFSRKDLAVQVDVGNISTGNKPPMASDYYPRLEKLAPPLILAGVLLLLLLWQVAIALIVLGLAVHFGAGYLRAHHHHRTTPAATQAVDGTCCETAMAKLCAQYIRGGIALVSSTHRAHWPDYPSSVLTGKHELIPGARSRTRH